MTQLTVLGGANEIGGNKLLLEDRGTRVFLDFGQSFNFGERYFTEYLGPRERFGLRDHLALDLLPRLSGLYSREMLAPTDLRYGPSEFHAVFLSHIHFDHTSHIRFIDPSIPVHLGETGKRMLDAWEESGRDSLGEHDYRTFRTGKRVRIDDIEVEPIHVDHSTPSAYGFIVHTSDATVAYTGDFRLHGPMARNTRDFIERARKARVDTLVCEGTRVAPRDKRQNLSEQGVVDRCDKIIGGTKKLVLTTFYPRDIDRMKSFHRLAVKHDRVFVVSSRVAYLLHALKDDPRIEVPDPLTDEHMGVYCRELLRTDEWERPLRGAGLGAEDIRKDPSSYILHLQFSHLGELVDIRPPRGSPFIRSMSEPFEEDDIEDEVLRNWMARFALELHQAHASGHCSMAEVFGAVEEIAPKRIVPVHTEHQELFRERFGGRVVLPAKGPMRV